MKQTLAITAFALAAVTAGAAMAQDKGASIKGEKEKCYGVAKAGQNDCKASAHDCKGHSTVDYDGASFKLVPAGTCEAMMTPDGKKGMLKPMEG